MKTSPRLCRWMRSGAPKLLSTSDMVLSPTLMVFGSLLSWEPTESLMIWQPASPRAAHRSATPSARLLPRLLELIRLLLDPVVQHPVGSVEEHDQRVRQHAQVEAHEHGRNRVAAPRALREAKHERIGE